MPVRLRNNLREKLYEITLKSLFAQKSKNWKAIIVGDDESKFSDQHLIHLKGDDLPKIEKLSMALDFIAVHPEIKPDYIIRLDEDDIVSADYLYDIENVSEKFDVYYDRYHVCIDPVYMKISYRDNNWIANTAIHKYEHAIKKCGPDNKILFLQNHDQFWHQYYADKKIYYSRMKSPLYFRILTPYSITSSSLTKDARTDWNKYSVYLNSYGPWIGLDKSFPLFDELKKISIAFKSARPKKTSLYWVYNLIKHYRNLFFDNIKKIIHPLEN